MKDSSPSQQPGTSSSSSAGGIEEPLGIQLTDEYVIKTEEEEIDQLKLPTEAESKEAADPAKEDDRIPKIPFHCESCDMNEMVHYYGQAAPFMFRVRLTEVSYVMRDPFQPQPPKWPEKPEFVILGAHCLVCEKVVCRDAQCSFYYVSTFCLQCALGVINRFPLEAQTRLRKQVASVQRD